jgi:hypothetical protein
MSYDKTDLFVYLQDAHATAELLHDEPDGCDDPMVARGCLDSIQYTDGDTERNKMEKVVLHRLLESQKETE